ncbi:MAG: hypothetical protein PHN45_00845 [Methylococcales bacterium]|nr:hypothetical protein [Methylococcales bacterium]
MVVDMRRIQGAVKDTAQVPENAWLLTMHNLWDLVLPYVGIDDKMRVALSCRLLRSKVMLEMPILPEDDSYDGVQRAVIHPRYPAWTREQVSVCVMLGGQFIPTTSPPCYLRKIGQQARTSGHPFFNGRAYMYSKYFRNLHGKAAEMYSTYKRMHGTNTTEDIVHLGKQIVLLDEKLGRSAWYMNQILVPLEYEYCVVRYCSAERMFMSYSLCADLMKVVMDNVRSFHPKMVRQWCEQGITPVQLSALAHKRAQEIRSVLPSYEKSKKQREHIHSQCILHAPRSRYQPRLLMPPPPPSMLNIVVPTVTQMFECRSEEQLIVSCNEPNPHVEDLKQDELVFTPEELERLDADLELFTDVTIYNDSLVSVC